MAAEGLLPGGKCATVASSMGGGSFVPLAFGPAIRCGIEPHRAGEEEVVETVVPAPEPGPRTASHPGKVREDWTPDFRCAPSGVTKRPGAGATLFRAYRARGRVRAFRVGAHIAHLIARASRTQDALRPSAESGSFPRRAGAAGSGPRMPLPSNLSYHGYSEVKPQSGIISESERLPEAGLDPDESIGGR